MILMQVFKGNKMKVKILKEASTKIFPQKIKFDGKWWYKDEQMDDDAWAYVNWDDDNNEHYITVTSSGHIEYN